jgi:hypothetical protein
MPRAMVLVLRGLLIIACVRGFLPVTIAVLLASPPALGKEQTLNINSSAKIMILGGHSVSLEKNELVFSYKEEITPVQKHIDYIFGQLQRQLSVLLDANVRYVSERTLSNDLEAQGLKRGSRESINALVEREDYTHVIASDVQMINGAGEVGFRLARLPRNGVGPTLKTILEYRLTESHSPSELDNVIADVVGELARLRDANALKFVDFSCIEPRTPVDSEYTLQLQLERALSQHITHQLIGFYHRSEMLAQGYRPIVRGSTFKIEITQDKRIKCTREASTIKIVQFPIIDYKIKGNVAVIQTVYRTNHVALTIEFVRTYPSACEKQIDLSPLEFDQGMYRRQDPFSRAFLPRVLPEYEQKWTASIESCPR